MVLIEGEIKKLGPLVFKLRDTSKKLTEEQKCLIDNFWISYHKTPNHKESDKKYFITFIKDIGKITGPLYAKTGKTGQRHFNSEDIKLVQQIKKLVTKLPDRNYRGKSYKILGK